VLDQHLLAGPVPLVLAADLGDGDVGLVDDGEEVLGEVVQQRVGGLAGGPAVEVAGVVLDPRAEPHLPQHLQVVGGPHPQALGLQQLPLRLQLGQPPGQLGFDGGDRLQHLLPLGDVVAGREDERLPELFQHLAGDRVHPQDPLDLVAEELDPEDRLLVGGQHLQGVAPHPELAPGEGHLVALVLDVDQPALGRLHRVLHPLDEADQLALVLLGRAQPVDAGHRGDDDRVPVVQQRRGGGVAEPVDLVVDRGVLLDVGVGLGEVRLGLVVVVVADEVLDPVLGEELAELVGELGPQRLVGGDHQGGPLHLFDRPGDRRRLPRPGDPKRVW
jgi:hypothetical protein